MRVAFINPPFLPNYSRGQRSPAVTRSGTLYYPLWLAYAACHAERLGHEILLLDAPAGELDREDSLNRLAAFAPDLALVETATPSIDNDLQFAQDLKKTLPPCRVYACGTHVSALPAQAIQQAPALDGLIIGEYEIPLEQILHAISQDSALANLEGVFLPGNQPRPRAAFFHDLDARPFVSEIYQRFLPIRRYFNPNAHHPTVAILAGRGCPHGCTFCVFPQTLTGRGYRKRSVHSLLEEFTWIAKNLPEVRGVFIEDDTFTADPARVRAFSEKLADLRLSLSWTANSRADVDLETLQAMKKSNLRALCTGFESGSQTLLNAINKGISLDDMRQFAQNARRAGVKIHGCFIAGLPGETRVTLQETLQFALDLPLDTAQFYPLMVYPGTSAYAWAENEHLITARTFRDWLSPEGLHQCVVKTKDLSSKQLVQFCNFARRRFYLRKSWLKEQALRVVFDADERSRVLRSTKTFLKHLLQDR